MNQVQRVAALEAELKSKIINHPMGIVALPVQKNAIAKIMAFVNAKGHSLDTQAARLQMAIMQVNNLYAA